MPKYYEPDYVEGLTPVTKWLWFGDRYTTFLTIFLSVVLTISLFNVVTNSSTIIMLLTNSIDLTSYKFYGVIIQLLSCLIMAATIGYIVKSYLKRVNCYIVGNTKKNIGSKYNWDGFISTIAESDDESYTEDIVVEKFTELCKWIDEQEFAGEVSLLVNERYEFMSIRAQYFRFRFTHEEDLIHVKLVWG